MMKVLVSTSPNPHPSNQDAGRLDSWKEIANYFRREVRTVQLWEKKEGLPVHRHFHKHLGSVFAFRSELKAWKEQVSQKSQAHQAGKEAEKPSLASEATQE